MLHPHWIGSVAFTAWAIALFPIATVAQQIPPAIINQSTNQSINQSTNQPIDQAIEVVERLTGVMQTRTPPNRNGESVTVQMTTCQVQLQVDSATDSAKADTAAESPSPANSPTSSPVSSPTSSQMFLYQEQALVEELDQPYRQRFLQILPTADGGVESRSFRPKQTELWVNFCSRQTERSHRTVQMSDLMPTDCSVLLYPAGTSFMGETPAAGCPTSFRGAARVTNQILLNEDGMVTRDRGYDANGNLLWGAREEPYRYRKIEASP